MIFLSLLGFNVAICEMIAKDIFSFGRAWKDFCSVCERSLNSETWLGAEDDAWIFWNPLWDQLLRVHATYCESKSVCLGDQTTLYLYCPFIM